MPPETQNAPLSIQQILTTACSQITHTNARLDAEVLLAHVLSKPRSYLYAWNDALISEAQYTQFNQLWQRCVQGEPLVYLLGYKEFWSLRFRVTPATLIPRPDTELLVEQALRVCATYPLDTRLTIIDLGTGSGAIACAIAHEYPQHRVLATDTSLAALAVAKENATQLGCQVEFIHSDWFSALHGVQAQLIVSNPPYIAADDPHLVALQHEPINALVAKHQGLAALYHLITQAPKHLLPNGHLLLEHGYEQGEQVRACFNQHGYQQIETHLDLAGLPRMTGGMFQ